MRVALLDPTILDRLHADALASQWRSQLQHAGYFADPSGGTAEARAFLGVRTELLGLEAAETLLVLTASPIPWSTGEVPRGVWWIVGITFAILAIIGELTVGLGVVIGAAFTPVVLLPLALVGLVFSARHELRRRDVRAAAKRARIAHGRALVGHVEALAFRTFVLASGGVLFVSAPHLAWITHRLRDLRMTRRPVEPPERGTLVAELEQSRDRIEAALRGAAIGDVPPAAALECSLEPLTRQFAALGVAPDRSGEGARLAAGLAALAAQAV